MFSVRLGSKIALQSHYPLKDMGKTMNQKIASLAKDRLTFTSNHNFLSERNFSRATKCLGALFLGFLTFHSKVYCDSPCQGFNYDLTKLQNLPIEEKEEALFSLIEKCKEISELGRAFEVIKLLPAGEKKDNELRELAIISSKMGKLDFSLSAIKEMEEKSKVFDDFLQEYGNNFEPKVLIEKIYTVLPSESAKEKVWELSLKKDSIEKARDWIDQMRTGDHKDQLLLKIANRCVTENQENLMLSVIKDISSEEKKEAALLQFASELLVAKKYLPSLLTIAEIKEEKVKEEKINTVIETCVSNGEYDFAIEAVKYLKDHAPLMLTLAAQFRDMGEYTFVLKALNKMPEGWETDEEAQVVLEVFLRNFIEAKAFALANQLPAFAEKPENLYSVLEDLLFTAKEYKALEEAIKTRTEGLEKQKAFADYAFKLSDAKKTIEGAFLVAQMNPSPEKEKAFSKLIDQSFAEKMYITSLKVADLSDLEYKDKILKDLIDKFLDLKDFGHAHVAALRIESSDMQKEIQAVIEKAMSPLTVDQCLKNLAKEYLVKKDAETAKKITFLRVPSWDREADLWNLWTNGWIR